MVVTDEKITVTTEMLDRANMLRGAKIGIPVNLDYLSDGLVWKDLAEMEEEDFDKLEQYFLKKSNEK